MINKHCKPIKFCSFGGYRRFCLWWWRDLIWYTTGVTFYKHEEFSLVSAGLPGWVYDIYAYWHRARYGWAPRDTWSLDSCLNHILAGTLEHLAEHSHGTPYVTEGTDVDIEFARWAADLRRWAQAFAEAAEGVHIYDAPEYTKQRAEEERRQENLHKALREIEPWWEALWS